MSKKLRIILVVVCGFVGLFVLAAVALRLLVDANAFRPRLEAAASGALGMEVSVGGRLGISIFPGLHVTLADVHIRNLGKDFVSAKEARLGVDVLPLLRKEVRLRTIALKKVRIAIERHSDGKFNFDRPEAAKVKFPALALARLSLSDGTLMYANEQTGDALEATHCRLDLRGLRLSGGGAADLVRSMSMTAELACGAIRRNAFTATDLKLSADGTNGVFELEPVAMRIFGGEGSGSIHADFAGAIPVYRVRYAVPRFHIEEFFKARSPQKIAEGLMNFTADLTMKGNTIDEIAHAVEGQVWLRGENLTLTGRDLDRQFSRFESSQNFNLVDVGAFFFAGPFGLVVTKGYDFASLFQKSGDSSRITTLVSDWTVERGVAHAQDVAMATNKNRLALQGYLDFPEERFKDVTMALIDARGCAQALQKITGTFQKPVAEAPNVLVSLTGPVFSLLKKGKDLFPGGECDVFYSGSVAAPE